MCNELGISNDKTLVSYCFLASLNNNESDLINTAYLPIFKRALSHYSITHESGKDVDLQKTIYDIYGLNPPLFTVRQLLKIIDNELSKKEKEKIQFKIFEKGGSFQVANYCFDELELLYQNEKRNAATIQSEFERYLDENGVHHSQVPRFVDFININKRKIVNFFSIKQERINIEDYDSSYVYHARFLQKINDGNNALYQLSKKLFIGSLIASIFESGLDYIPKHSSDTHYYFDTQFILKALDLQNEEDSQPTIELIEIITKSGGKLKILDITLDEIQFSIDNALHNFSSKPVSSSIKNRSINHACFRRNISKTDLQKYSNSLKSIIETDLKIEIVKISNDIKEKAKKSTDIKNLEKQRDNPSTALHDVAAYLFIREKRGGFLSSYNKAKYWFVTPNYFLYIFNRTNIPTGMISEITTPELLTSLLWFKNPKILGDNIANMGLHEIISDALLSNLPSAQVLNNFDDNLKKYSSLSTQDYESLISNLANESIDKLERLNEVASKDSSTFNAEVLYLVKSEKDKRRDTTEKISTLEASAKEIPKLFDQVQKLNRKLERLSSEIDTTNSIIYDKIDETNKLKEKIKQIKSLIKYAVIFISILIILYFIWNYITLDLLRNIFTVIAILGGLSSFGTFLINLIRYFKE